MNVCVSGSNRVEISSKVAAKGAAAATAAANAANGQCGCEEEDAEVWATGMDDASAPVRGGGCRSTPSMYGGPRGAADAGLFLRLPFAAFAASLLRGGRCR
jgi:hypothetical protein